MAENEYIERKSIVDSIRKDFDFYYQIPIYLIDRDVQNIINRVNRVVQEIPAADVVEVVRCEHCKFCSTVVDFIGNCQSFCGEYPTPRMVKPKDFCSYGERKESTP